MTTKIILNINVLLNSFTPFTDAILHNALTAHRSNCLSGVFVTKIDDSNIGKRDLQLTRIYMFHYQVPDPRSGLSSASRWHHYFFLGKGFKAKICNQKKYGHYIHILALFILLKIESFALGAFVAFQCNKHSTIHNLTTPEGWKKEEENTESQPHGRSKIWSFVTVNKVHTGNLQRQHCIWFKTHTNFYVQNN